MITNVGPVHLELVETIENVARAKAELIDALPARRRSPSFREEPLLEPYLDARRHRRSSASTSRRELPFATSYTARASAR